MQITVMLLFLAVWLFIFWLGSIALEATGLERTKARFQALSALTGTGFTTGEAESVVNHPRRRRIASWLIFIGNAGIIAFIILLVFYVRAGLTAPSLLYIGIIIVIILIISLIVRLGLLDRLTSGLIKLVRKGRPVSDLLVEGILYQAGQYGVARIRIKDANGVAGRTIKDTGLGGRDITVLSIERGNTVLSLPEKNEKLLAGDCLLCYGKVTEVVGLT
jgi:hypothetical protein